MDALSYIAGILDGEGSIELKMQRKGTLDLTVHIFNSDWPLFEWIETHFGGKTYDIHRRARTEKPQWKPVYNWNIGGQRGRDFLLSVSPNLLIKRPQADLAVEAWDNRQAFYRGTGPGRVHLIVPEHVIALRRSYVDRMHELNRLHRGPT